MRRKGPPRIKMIFDSFLSGPRIGFLVLGYSLDYRQGPVALTLLHSKFGSKVYFLSLLLDLVEKLRCLPVASVFV